MKEIFHILNILMKKIRGKIQCKKMQESKNAWSILDLDKHAHEWTINILKGSDLVNPKP
jgi:hypothetical protein